MDSRTLGRSGLQVTRIGLGLAALGRPGYINLGHAEDLNRSYAVREMELSTHAVLDAAWEAGIRYFDVARSYGRAEKFLASWLHARDISAQSVTVGSKWGYTYTADWQVTAEHHEIKEHSLPVLDRQVNESRSLLGDYLDLYQIHSATMESAVLDNKEVLARLTQLRDDGLAIGLSTSGPRQADTIRKALSVRPDGQPLFTAVQATWNILAQEAASELQEAHAAGMGIIIKEAVANGRLTARNTDPEFARQYQQLQELAQIHHTTIDAIAIAAVLEQPWVDVVLSGAATISQLESNVQALAMSETGWLSELIEEMVEPPEYYWQRRANLEWN